MSVQILAAEAAGDIIVCDEGLSFWGGVDPASGRVIDAHHHLTGAPLAGRIVMMPTSRGSCSGSGVLLELALNGCAPAALIFREPEDILTLGALIAADMFGRRIAVIRLSPADYDALAAATAAEIRDGRIVADGLSVPLARRGDALGLSGEDQSMLSGQAGDAAQLAMRVIAAMGAAQGAPRLIDVTRAHIDGCILHSDANLIFAERMREMGARARIPTTINAISIDLENWRDQGVASDFGARAQRLAEAYVAMGARPTFTCAPYQADDAPGEGEMIGWSESNAVIYANSVLGARTAKHADFLDLFIAVTGRAPLCGVYLDAERAPGVVIDVAPPPRPDDSFWPLLGWCAGRASPDRIPLIRGVEGLNPSDDDLRALCAAFGATSAAPMLHVAGATPEADRAPAPDALHRRLDAGDFAAALRSLNDGPEEVDLIALGSPHFSLSETRRFAGLLTGPVVIPTIVTLSRATRDAAEADGTAARLSRLGVRFVTDLCWCSITEPVFPTEARSVMTNSGKYAHYGPGLSGRRVRFGGLAACAAAAMSGRAPV